ncbi:MAG TPA: hypothetical protein VHP83_21260 [Aggregatilineaceae bacterium]|nr:hypothetical protein [Aggregatilineaceae bacterium]
MKKMALILMIALLVPTVLAACGGGSPVDTVKDMVKALEDKDEKKVNDLACTKDENPFGDSEGAEMSFKDMKYEEKSKDGDKAEVKMTGTMTIKYEGQETEVPVDEIVKLEKKDGDWCIADAGE